MTQNTSYILPSEKGKFKVLYNDGRILAVDKSAGVLSIPGRFDDPDDNLTAFLNNIFGKVFVVHRLDRDTSGIMLFALDAEMHRELSLLFENNNIQKIYHAVLSGVPTDDYDIDIPIASDPSKKGKSMPSGMGKSSLTRMKIVKDFRKASLVKCDLVTGRHHQLRVHVAAIGNPLLVDPLYGTREEFYLSEFKNKFNLKKNTDERPLISRITMHAHSLEFTNPFDNSKMYFEAEWPKDFKALINQLSKLK